MHVNSSIWPENGLERVTACPICNCNKRQLLHDKLSDRIFFCAPGEWKLYRCADCASGYLDPRPTADTIALAYSSYYTHSVNNVKTKSLGKKILRKTGDIYRHAKFGQNHSVVASLIGSSFPGLASRLDADMRHLPAPYPEAKLLDIGCGSGQFLARASALGWSVAGIDVDTKAVERARNRGLDVSSRAIDRLDFAPQSFDVITLRHVIEHVHNHGTVLEHCYRLLKPNGWVWIETPNIQSQGHHEFGMDWRDLDAPRHLVLFNVDSLTSSLTDARFTNIEHQPWRPVIKEVFRDSISIYEQRLKTKAQDKIVWLKKVASSLEDVAKLDPRKREFITVKAFKN